MVLRVPAFRDTFEELQAYRHAFRFVPPGHFYSPLPSPEELRQDASRLFRSPPPTIPGIDLNEAKQLELLAQISRFYPELRFPVEKSPAFRYFYDNPAYSYSDAICLYGMIRHAQARSASSKWDRDIPRAVMLDTIDRHLDGDARCTFIEPYPAKLLSLLRPEDLRRVTILEKRVRTWTWIHFWLWSGTTSCSSTPVTS